MKDIISDKDVLNIINSQAPKALDALTDYYESRRYYLTRYSKKFYEETQFYLPMLTKQQAIEILILKDKADHFIEDVFNAIAEHIVDPMNYNLNQKNMIKIHLINKLRDTFFDIAHQSKKEWEKALKELEVSK